MSDLKVCRICLRAQCKVYKYDRYQLKAYYEEVMAEKINDTDGLPHYFCYECATILHKFHKFKEKCWMGQHVLKKVQAKNEGTITYEDIHRTDRQLFNLVSPVQILIVTKRVKTYVTIEKEEIFESECDSITAEDEKDINSKDIEKEQVFLNDSPNDDNFDSEMPEEDSKDFVIKESIVLEENKDKEITDQIEVVVTKVEVDNESEIANEIDSEIEIGSPKTVFVDVKKDIVVVKSESIKERRKSFSEYGLKKLNPRFAKIKHNYLDGESWKKYTLTEEEAVKQFQLKAENCKYKNAAFKCVDCFKGFSKEEMLKRHKQLRHSEKLGRLECRFCHKRFKWDSKLRRHMSEHFTRYKCLLCGIEVCVETTAIMHEDWHKGELKKCQHCGEEFRHRSTYYTHLRTHRSKYVCTLCGMSFVSPTGLHMHMKIKHVNHEIDSPDDDEPVNTFCERCDITFETRKAFEEHLFHSALHSDVAEDEELNKIQRKVLGKRSQAKITQSLNRNSTDEELPARHKKGRRPRHRRCHKKPSTCNQCGKHFETQAACMKHHQTEHPRTSFFSERHICEICGASLAPGSVAMHQNIHSRQKEFPCNTCDKKFHSSVGLKRHLVTHTGEKPFACTLCDKRFTQSNSMKLHYKTFHLKQPYPKRNRRKNNKDGPPEVPSTEGEESEASLPAPEPRIEPAPPPTVQTDNHESMHYLTLS